MEERDLSNTINLSNLCYDGMDEDEMSISIRELFFTVLKKWKMILLIVILGAIFGFGYAMVQYQGIMSDEKKLEEKINYVNIGRYNLLKEQIATDESYLRDNPKMRMDYNNVYSAVREYEVRATSDVIAQVQSSYKALGSESDVINGIIEQTGLEMDPQYFDSLFTYTIELGTPEVLTSLQSLSQMPQQALTISAELVLSNKENCTKVLDAFEERLDALTSFYKNSFVLIMERTRNSISFGRNEEIMQAQLDAQKAYYNNQEELRKMEKSTLSKDELLWIEEGRISSHWKKYVVLVGAGAGVLAVLAIVVLDLLNGKVRDITDLSLMGAPVLAYIDREKNKKGPDGWIQRWERSVMPESNDPAYIHQVLMDVGTPLVVTDETGSGQAVKSFAKECFPENVVVTNSLSKDPEALRAAQKCGKVILWVRLQDSRMDKVVQARALAQTMHFSVKGFIVEKSR